MKRTFDAIIKHTDESITLIYPNESYVMAELKRVFPDGHKLTVEYKSRRKPRSLSQNAYFHMVLGLIADECGQDLDAVKSTVKTMYAKKPLLDKEGEPIYDKATGEQAMYIQDTSDMDTIEMTELVDKTRMFALDFFGMDIPLPSENIELKFK
jgi:hypothetical protein